MCLSCSPSKGERKNLFITKFIRLSAERLSCLYLAYSLSATIVVSWKFKKDWKDKISTEENTFLGPSTQCEFSGEINSSDLLKSLGGGGGETIIAIYIIITARGFFICKFPGGKYLLALYGCHTSL